MHSGVGYAAPRVVPHDRATCGAPPRCSTRASASRCSSARARCGADGRGRRRSPTCSAPASPRRCSARRSLPDDLPFVTGSIGLLGTKPSWDMMQSCDTLLMVGSSFPYSEFLPEGGPGARRADRHRRPHARHPLPDGGQPRRRRAETLRALLPLLAAQGRPRAGGEQIEEQRRATGGELLEARAHGRRRSDQPAARLLGAVAAAARRLHPHRRLRLGGQLVRARPESCARA